MTEVGFVTKWGIWDRLCGLVVRVPGYRCRGSGFDSRIYQIFWEVVGLEMALTSPTGCGRLVGIVRLRTKSTELWGIWWCLKTTSHSHSPSFISVPSIRYFCAHSSHPSITSTLWNGSRCCRSISGPMFLLTVFLLSVQITHTSILCTYFQDICVRYMQY
jgi:hypothetical protein